MRVSHTVTNMASVGSPGLVGSSGCSDRSSSMLRNGISVSVLVEATFFVFGLSGLWLWLLYCEYVYEMIRL